MTTAAVIVAAGRGTRAGEGPPKQWRAIAGQSSVARCVAAFRDHPGIDVIVLVIHPDDADKATEFADHTVLADGGTTRGASVLAGLRALDSHGVSRVLIHDVARPLIPAGVITKVLDALETSGGAAPALAVTDALWKGLDGKVDGVQSRDGLFRAQTPQGFRFDDILTAHLASDGGAADDVEVARAGGIDVTIVKGDERNFKITFEDDFRRAEKMLRGDMDVRCGNGYDVHRFGDGDHVTLCGVTIHHGRGLQGHSDADVGMHAVTDAIYGALAEGDVGRHFPPSDPKWKGAASDIFLRHACDMARDRGFQITHMDCTLVCEYPKIGPHAAAMVDRMAEIMQLSPDRVSIKATTSERLGFTGREEGIAAIATATLVRG